MVVFIFLVFAVSCMLFLNNVSGSLLLISTIFVNTSRRYAILTTLLNFSIIRGEKVLGLGLFRVMYHGGNEYV